MPRLIFAVMSGVLMCAALTAAPQQQVTPPDDSTRFADFVEPDFPFITTTLEAGGLAPHLPRANLIVRGLVFQLGRGVYACFDPDLLRMAVAWKGRFMSLATMAQSSYHQPTLKSITIPKVLGSPIVATGIHPGWMSTDSDFKDPRSPGPNPDDVGRGPIPARLGRWNGVFVDGSRVVLSYKVLGTDVLETPGVVEVHDEVGFTRTFSVGRIAQPLMLLVAEITGAEVIRADGRAVVLRHGSGKPEVTAVGVSGGADREGLRVIDGRHVVLNVGTGSASSDFRITMWSGSVEDVALFYEMLNRKVETTSAGTNGGSGRWRERVETVVRRAPDTTAVAYDRIDLPVPNPWRRNVRVADIDFFDDGRIAAVTFEGDVWLALTTAPDRLQWSRFASGLYEPLSLVIQDDDVFVYGREGIVRLHDLNADGEADFYENFSNAVIQSSETREWPLAMEVRPEGGFYISKGGALHAGPPTSEAIMEGFRNGSRHAGRIMEVSADGRDVRVMASGFREPFIGVHPGTGTLTASDQQGNFVPSTPIYAVRNGGYYGVPATARAAATRSRATELPLTWIPHSVDPSGTGQVWITSDRMGPLNGRLLHLSYARPGVFMVYVDSSSSPIQGGVAPLPGAPSAPLLKAAIHPVDGLVYAAGFRIWGTTADDLSSLVRIRYTGLPLDVPVSVAAGRQGIILRFDQGLDAVSAEDASAYRIRRWNYHRSSSYGSGHYRLDGSEGEEELPVAGAHLSEDGRSVFVAIPDMRRVMQLQVDYRLGTAGGLQIDQAVYLTINDVRDLDLSVFGLDEVDWLREIQRGRKTTRVPAREYIEPTPERGRHLVNELACLGCHSTDQSRSPSVGPPLYGLYASRRPLSDGTETVADSSYVTRSILDPSAQIVAGFEEGMPSYRGVLGATDLESLFLFIRTLRDE